MSPQHPRRLGVRPPLRVLEGAEAPTVRLTDAELMDAFETGDTKACEELYDRLIGVVEGTLWRVLGRRDEHHDDLVQTAFEQIVVTLSRRKFARACSLASWASSVTTNVAFNVIRSRTRERRVVDRRRDAEAEARGRSSADDVERNAGTREILLRVREHLATMDDARAKTLFLHDVLGHDLAEISVLTGVSIAAAQSRLVRARKELVAKIGQDDVATKSGERP